MLDSIIKLYNRSKLKAVEAISDSKNNIFVENGFLDDSDIEMQIKYVKESIAAIDADINNCLNNKNADKSMLSQLSKKRKEMIVDFVFLASNNIDNAERLLQIADESYVIHRWLLAVVNFKNHDYVTAYQYLAEHIENNNCFKGHYLFNVIAGDLFVQSKRYKKALTYYQEAVKRRPDSIDIHKKLLMIYEQLNDDYGIAAEESIIELLSKEEE